MLAAGPATAQAVNAPVLKWQRGGCFASWCQTGWYASPAVADLDGDGQPEVIWGAYDLVVLDGATGTLRARAANASRVWPSVAVADLSGDGTLEIAVGRGADQLTVYRPTTTAGVMTLGVLWARNPFGLGEVRTLAVDDLDGDGPREVIVGRAGSGETLQLHVFEADGTPRTGWPARRNGEPGYGWGMYNENVAVADLDGDGDKELIGPTDTHYITALDRTGSQLAASSFYGAGKVWSQVGVHVDEVADVRGYAFCGTEHRPNFANMGPAIGDLDRNGTPEIVVPGDVYNCDVGDGPGDLAILPWVFHRDRRRWTGSGYDWTVIPAAAAGSAPLSEDYNLIENSVSNAVLADLDGDGRKEILYAAYDGRVHAFWLDKTEHGNWPYDVPGTGWRFAAEPVVVDLNGDGPAEVIFTSWGQKAGATIGQVHVLDAMGNLLHAVDLPPSFSAGSWNGGLAAPTVANIDADADYELVVGTSHSGVVAYDLPGTARARLRWPTGRGTQMRTGVAPDVLFADGLEFGPF
jgi:VCBS repeat protein/FG-GAP repeat protein